MLSTKTANGPPQPTAVLRAHGAEVHALAFLEAEKGMPPCIISGSLDGMIVLWDPVAFSPLFSWRGHTGGVLALESADPSPHDSGPSGRASPSPLTFLSQGRDGCVHAWRMGPVAHAEEHANPVEEEDRADEVDDLDLIRDLLPGSASGEAVLAPGQQAMQGPTKMWTLRVGFGGFCRMARLNLGPRDSRAHVSVPPLTPAVVYATPGEATSAVDLWVRPADERVCPQRAARLTIPKAAAVDVARALGRMDGDAEGGGLGGGGSIADALQSTGMLMQVVLVKCAPLESEPGHSPAGRDSKGFGTAAGRLKDPPAGPGPAASGLSALLRTMPAHTPAPSPPSSPPGAGEHAHASVLAVACYENGGVYVLQAGGQGDAQTHVLVTLPVCSEPLMALALCPDAGADGELTGCVTSSSSTVHLFTLHVARGRGSVVRRVTLSTPGASVCVPLPASHSTPGALFLVGGWDGALRVISGGGEEGAPEVQVTRWQASSIYAAAVTRHCIAVGCLDGRVYMFARDD